MPIQSPAKPLPLRPLAVQSALDQANATAHSVRLAVGASLELGDPFRLARACDWFPQIGWMDVASRQLWLGLGAADELMADDRARALALPDAARARLEAMHWGGLGLKHVVRYLGGVAFDPDDALHPDWPAGRPGRFVLPRWLLRFSLEDLSRGFAVAIVPVNPGETPEFVRRRLDGMLGELTRWLSRLGEFPREAPRARHVADPEADRRFRRAVRTALADDPTLAKIVLSRDLALEALRPFEPWSVFEGFERRGRGHRFCFRFDDQAAFLGATPERLMALEGDRVSADCLAGTVARGATSEEDARLANWLLDHDKDRREHAAVVEAVRAALAPCCGELEVPNTPVVVALPTVQHLFTPVRGLLRADVSLGTLLERLHPTPAVCGTPRERAPARIRHHEGRPRGWYAGALGWVGCEEADFAVGIRSAIVHSDRAVAISGAGVVAGSDPDAEYEETERKAAGMLALLEGPRA